MSTTTSHTGKYDHSIGAWEKDQNRKEKLLKMLKNKSKEEIIQWLISGDAD